MALRIGLPPLSPLPCSPLSLSSLLILKPIRLIWTISDWKSLRQMSFWSAKQTKTKSKDIREKEDEGEEGAKDKQKREQWKRRMKQKLKNQPWSHDPWSVSHDLVSFIGHSGAWITFRLRGRGRGEQCKGKGSEEGEGEKKNREGQLELETGRNQRTMRNEEMKWNHEGATKTSEVARNGAQESE